MSRPDRSSERAAFDRERAEAALDAPVQRPDQERGAAPLTFSPRCARTEPAAHAQQQQ